MQKKRQKLFPAPLFIVAKRWEEQEQLSAMQKAVIIKEPAFSLTWEKAATSGRFKDKLHDDVSSRGCKLVTRGGREFCVLGTVLSASHSELTLFSQ